MTKKYLVLLMPLLLAACATPQSRYPDLSAEDVRKEQQFHKQILEQKGQSKDLGNVKAKERHLSRMKIVAPKIAKSAQNMCKEINISIKDCSFDFVVLREGPYNAYADGEKIYVTPNLMDTMDANNELAFVLAHEYAHNLMRHVQATQQNVGIASIIGLIIDSQLGTNGQISRLGGQFAQLRYSKSFEQEADYVGMYILARAGYDIDEVATVWREASLRNPNAIYNATTHPTNPERFIALSHTVEEIQQKKKEGKQLLPDMKES